MIGAILGFVRINWKPFALLAVAALAWWLLHRYGEERYAAGQTARDRYWQPLFLAAEKAAAEANAKTASIESAQTAATKAAEARHADEITAINARAADAQRRLRALSLRLAANSTAGGCKVSSVPRAAPESVEPSPSAERAERTADALGDLGRRCELDAAAVSGWQHWYAEQAAIRNTAGP